MEAAYAQALWQLVKGGMTPHAAVKAIKEKLEKDGRAALLPRVRSAFQRLAQRESRKNTIVLTIAREKDERAAKSEAKEIVAALGEQIDLETQVDDSIIGGWRLEGKGVLVDKSHKSALMEIYNRVTK